MQTEKFQPDSKQIIPETSVIEFLSLSVEPRIGIFRSASDLDDLFFLPIIEKTVVL